MKIYATALFTILSATVQPSSAQTAVMGCMKKKSTANPSTSPTPSPTSDKSSTSPTPSPTTDQPSTGPTPSPNSDQQSNGPTPHPTADVPVVEEPPKVEGQCTVSPEASIGVCAAPSSMKFIVNSCGDVTGPTVLNRAMEAAGHDLTTFKDKAHFSKAWEYMRSLEPDAIFLAGDNVYNDGIADWGKAYHPFGNNLATILADAGEDFQKFHGYLTEDGKPGPLFYGYLEILKDKMADGYLENDEFIALREFVNDSVHATWDDHDYLTNDPSNPNYIVHEFRKASIDVLTGWDKKYFRFGPAHKGIERTWTTELTDNKGKPFMVRFIVLDEETTHFSTQGCAYYYNPESPTGFTPRLAKDKTKMCPDLDVIEDFENPARPFFGDSQLEWFREQLMKPADLIFVMNGGPNFELDYDYASLTEFPGEKRKFIEILRETGAEHVIFLTGDSHASYVTKMPNLVGYPLHTIVGSGLTQGLSYDRYINFWGDISHRFLVAAGSTANVDKAASFAEVDVMFDDDGAFVRFTPHLIPGTVDEDGTDTGFGPDWYPQTTKNPNEPWEAQYDIRVSDLEIADDWPRYHYDSTIPHKFVTEAIYFKWAAASGTNVTVDITNAHNEKATFPVEEGANCGTGYYGFCKDRWGAFSYTATFVGTYAPSIVNQEMCQHAGHVGDEIMWSIAEDGVEVASGSLVLKIRNNVLVNSAGELEDLWHFGTQNAYNSVTGDSVGVCVARIMVEPPVYGGYTVPVKGWDGTTFDNADVQAAYDSYQAMSEDAKDCTALQAVYLATYYPNIPKL